MPAAKKKTAGKSLKKIPSTVVVVTEKRISPKDTLFPEKVAEAKKILSNTKFHDPKIFF